MPLLRSHLPPLLTQLVASFRRHLPETVEGLSDLLLALGGQCFVLLPALTQHLPLLGRYGAPLREALLRAGALLRRHRQPAFAAFRERLLPIRRQAVPLGLMVLQHLLLLWRQ